MNRREFLACAGGLAVRNATAQAAIPIIDAHIHLFDQNRPQGAPYSAAPGNKEPAYPARYRKLAEPLGIVGAIEVEASPWIEDNLWILQVEEPDPFMVGTIGNLQPEKPEFKEYLDRYHKNPLFLGIRYGNLWGYSLSNQLSNPVFIEGLRHLQQADLTMDSANPNAELIRSIVRVSDKVPDLRIVVDHLPALLSRLSSSDRAPIETDLRELASRPQVYFKVSEVLHVKNGSPVTDPADYKSLLDYFFDTFGPDKLIFGSDWPNSIAVDNLPQIVTIVKNYFMQKGTSAAQKYFWRNSQKAYKWVKRRTGQPSPA